MLQHELITNTQKDLPNAAIFNICGISKGLRDPLLDEYLTTVNLCQGTEEKRSNAILVQNIQVKLVK